MFVAANVRSPPDAGTARPGPWYLARVGKTEEGRGRWTGGCPVSAECLPVLRPVRVPWNKGRIIGERGPLLPRPVWSMRVRLEMAGNARDLALFDMAVDCKQHGCDLVGLWVRDVFATGRVKERTSMIQSKTGKPVRFEITVTTKVSLERWIGNPEMIGI